jgi:SAM-dependent methyltransferase
VPAAADLTHYHQAISGAHEQFDHQETTLSHLLRVPHPALGGKTYGAKLVDALTGKLPAGKLRVLEIGAGLGYVARDAIARLRELDREVDYTIVELSPALADAQQKLLGNRATWMIADALTAKLDGEFDLILSNEMVGDLPAVQATRADLGLAADGSGEADRAKVAAISELAAAHVMLDDAPEPLYLQTGAFELVAKLAKHLAPGGTMAITEFGDRAKWPTLSTHLDHPELSTHFGHLQQIAKGVGLDAEIVFVIDLLDFDRDQRGLATTRSQFRALRALATDSGIELEKIGYTPELLEHTVAGKLDLAQVGDLRFDRIEDRLMGLVPHEFKALMMHRPR